MGTTNYKNRQFVFRTGPFFFLICLLWMFWGCGDVEVIEKTPEVVEPTNPRIRKAWAWADSVLHTLSPREKLAQIMIVPTPNEAGRAANMAAFSDLVDSLKPGGILLKPGQPELQYRLSYEFQSKSGAPRWIALDIDDDWARERDYPALYLMGAAGQDDLAEKWGLAVGREARAVGAQLCFTSCAKVSPDTLPLPSSMGADPLRVTNRSLGFRSGLRSAGVLPVFRALPTPEDLLKTTGSPKLKADFPYLLYRDLYPLEIMMEKGLTAAQLNPVILPKIDTLLPAPLSEVICKSIIRNDFGFSGLLFSPSLSDSFFTRGKPEPEVALASLIAGADVLVEPTDFPGTLDFLSTALQKEKIPALELDMKVRKVLIAKYLNGLNTYTVSHPDSTVFKFESPWTEATALHLTTSAMTVLKNDHNRLPLAGAETRKLASVSVGAGSRTWFQRAMYAYTDVDHSVLSANASAGLLNQRVTALKNYDYVLVGIHESGNDADTLSDALQEFLADLSAETRVAVVNFGGIRRISKLDSLPCIVQANDNRRGSQELAGKLIFGAVEAKGMIPVDVEDKFCIGHGLPCEKVYRFNYTFPEDAGIDRQKLAKIDSIVHTALYLGVFPGCQVFAAKDGKVFYDKAFGHHSYDRKLPVRRDDLYDVASITKIAATTLATMYSVDQDSLELKGRLKQYIPDIDSAHYTIKDIQVDQLMIHKAGLPSGLPTYYYFTTMDSVDSVKSVYWKKFKDSVYTVRVTDDLYFNETYHDTLWRKICQTKLYNWGRYVYSDMSMFLMKKTLESVYDEDLNKLVDRLFYKPMGLKTMTYLPTRKFEKDRIIPTEEDRFFRKSLIHGHVHDPNAALWGGVGGHAGLFSNAEDLGIIMQMLLNGGQYGGKRYLSDGVVRLFTNRYPDSHRGLGFDMQSPGQDYVMCCKNASARCFGHTGFTGTCAWADPEHNIVFVFLSNRVYPSAKNQKINIYRIRQGIQEAIYDALGIVPEPYICYDEEPCEDPLNPGWVDEDCDALNDSCAPEEPLPNVPDSVLP